MRSPLWAFITALIFALSLAACGTTDANLPILDQAASAQEGSPNAYRLGPGDKLKVTVFGAQDMSGDFIVTDAGHVASPLVGDIKAAGLSPQEFAAALRRKLADGYMRDPRVSVQVG